MSETRFDGTPNNGTQVSLAPTGPAITPYRVTVTKNGQLVKSEDFTLKADAQRLYDQELRAINAKGS